MRNSPAVRNAESNSGISLIGPLKDQIALLALLVTLAGLASTEAYYTRFNIQYQFLGFPATHIVYRGISIVLSGFYVCLPYLLASSWLLVIAGRLAPLSTERFQLTVTYVVIFVVTIATYALAWQAGKQQADRDRVEASCTLPKIMDASLKDLPNITALDGFRLLLVDNDNIVIFRPLDRDGKDEAPIIRRISKDAVRSLDTVR